MEILFEILMDFVLEGSIEGIKNKKVPMFLRIFLFFIVAALFLSVIFMFLALGIKVMEESTAGGIMLIGVGMLLAILVLRKCIRYLKEREGQEDDISI